MKKLLRVTILIITSCLFLFSCGKSNDDNKGADFSMLGLTSAVINGKQYDIKKDVMPDISTARNITITGMQKSRNKATLEYVILNNPEEVGSVMLYSRYSDTYISSVKSEDKENAITTYTITVKRAGYEAEMTYIFHFKTL
ncbi:MAG: hypothetical protein LKI53_05010 [Bacteroidales bacterium]|jgi:hypothetical protein|nr:hypothetical protein [Bacteroidales bacterium]